jgi:hypothetical protein
MNDFDCRVSSGQWQNRGMKSSPATNAERRLCDRKGGRRLGAREWARCADSGRSGDGDRAAGLNGKQSLGCEFHARLKNAPATNGQVGR